VSASSGKVNWAIVSWFSISVRIFLMRLVGVRSAAQCAYGSIGSFRILGRRFEVAPAILSATGIRCVTGIGMIRNALEQALVKQPTVLSNAYEKASILLLPLYVKYTNQACLILSIFMLQDIS